MLTNMRAFAVTIAGVAALLTTGCTISSTPYQPLSAGSRVLGGYSDLRIDETHYRVSFAGNRLTSREQVESYLLFRAAELTLLKGYDYFIIEDREVEHQIEREVRRDPLYDPWFAGRYGFWRPYWRYYRTGAGWYHWYPYFGDPFWADRYSVRAIERFEASADIVLGKGTRPNGNVRSFDAREISDRLAPQINYPA